jgi:hypothetical protein
MFFIVDTFVKALFFEIGTCFGIFVLPIIMHACFGMPYIN